MTKIRACCAAIRRANAPHQDLFPCGGNPRYIGGMTRRPAHFLLTSLAAILIALVSVLSAHLMAPDRDEPAREMAALSLGLSYDDICGDLDGAHDHRCPFCRLLSDPPDMRPELAEGRLRYSTDLAQLSDLTIAAQAGNPNISARAPPALI